MGVSFGSLSPIRVFLVLPGQQVGWLALRAQGACSPLGEMMVAWGRKKH